jgi:small subunit ribosomal protein S4
MGDIRRQRKKFSKPTHPWNKERILAEQELLKAYGLNRKKEIWKMSSILSNFARQAKELITEKDEVKKGQLLRKLVSLGLLDKNAGVEDILSIKLNDILERRLQTLVFRKNLARSMKQARQFIVHEHISIGDRKITVPSYLVSVNEESLIQFTPDSSLANPEHSERVVSKKDKKVKKEAPKEARADKEKTEKEAAKDKSEGKEEKRKSEKESAKKVKKAEVKEEK